MLYIAILLPPSQPSVSALWLFPSSGFCMGCFMFLYGGYGDLSGIEYRLFQSR